MEQKLISHKWKGNGIQPVGRMKGILLNQASVNRCLNPNKAEADDRK